MLADQAGIKAELDFLRYAMKPTPAKPRIIIAHVEASATARLLKQLRFGGPVRARKLALWVEPSTP